MTTSRRRFRRLSIRFRIVAAVSPNGKMKSLEVKSFFAFECIYEWSPPTLHHPASRRRQMVQDLYGSKFCVVDPPGDFLLCGSLHSFPGHDGGRQDDGQNHGTNLWSRDDYQHGNFRCQLVYQAEAMDLGLQSRCDLSGIDQLFDDLLHPTFDFLAEAGMQKLLRSTCLT